MTADIQTDTYILLVSLVPRTNLPGTPLILLTLSTRVEKVSPSKTDSWSEKKGALF